MFENHISDVKLWYFYETQSISSQAQWDSILDATISQASLTLEDCQFEPVWENASQKIAAPVAMTEKTYSSEGSISHTDQFCMPYERKIKENFLNTLCSVVKKKLSIIGLIAA